MLYYTESLIRVLRRHFRIRLLGWQGKSSALSRWGIPHVSVRQLRRKYVR